MPFYQKFQRLLLLFLRKPHPYMRIFNRVIINNVDDERKKIVPKIQMNKNLNYQNRFLRWTYQMQQLNKTNNRGFKDLKKEPNRRIAHSLQQADYFEDPLEMDTIFSSYQDDRGMYGTSWQFEELNSSVTESL